MTVQQSSHNLKVEYSQYQVQLRGAMDHMTIAFSEEGDVFNIFTAIL